MVVSKFDRAKLHAAKCVPELRKGEGLASVRPKYTTGARW